MAVKTPWKLPLNTFEKGQGYDVLASPRFPVHPLPGKTITKIQILLKRKLLGCSCLCRMLVSLAGKRTKGEVIGIKCQLHTLISRNPTITLQGFGC